MKCWQIMFTTRRGPDYDNVYVWHYTYAEALAVAVRDYGSGFALEARFPPGHVECI